MDVNFLLYSTLFLLLPFGQLTRINLFAPEINFYLHEIVLVILLVLNRKNIWKELKKLKYFWGFVGVGLISTFLNIGSLKWIEMGISLLYLIRFVSYTLLYLGIKNLRDERLRKIWLWSIGLTVGLGFLQYFVIPNQEFLFASNWDRHNFRLTGTYLDPGFTGVILSMMFFMVIKLKEKSDNFKLFDFTRRLKFVNKIFLSNSLKARVRIRNDIGWWTLMILIVISILLTYSRASYVGFLIALGYFGLVKNKFKWGFVFGLIFVLSLFVLPKKFGEGTKLLRTSTIEARLGNYSESVGLIMKRPILGWGFNTLRYVKRDEGLTDEKWQVSHGTSGMDNSLLFVLATTGIVGLVLYGLMWKEILPVKVGLINKCILIVVVVGGMFSNVWFYPFVLGYFLLWMGREN